MAVASSAAQNFIPIQEIRDGVVILKDGTMRMLLMASSINLALKSSEEQTGIILQFQSFLNTLEFSTQFFIQSRRLDIKPYLKLLQARLENEPNDLMKVQIREYMNFIKVVTESSNIMNKLFVVVVPYTPAKSVIASSGGGVGFLDKILGSKSKTPTKESPDMLRAFEEARSQLEQRAGIVSQGLSRTGVRVKTLGTEELTELYYHLFNPGESERQVSSK